jgi:hypothetical protein
MIFARAPGGSELCLTRDISLSTRFMCGGSAGLAIGRHHNSTGDRNLSIFLKSYFPRAIISLMTGVVDYQSGTRQHNGFANRVSFG